MLVSVLSTLAFAEEPAFAGTVAPPPEPEEDKVEGHLSAELGGSYATGNAEFLTLNGGAKGDVKWSQNQIASVVGVNYGRAVPDTDGDGHISDPERDAGYVESARKAAADLRYDRFFGDRDSLYVLGGALTDPFAGYDLRTHEQLGYSHLFITNDTTRLVGEVGFDVAQENFVDGVDPARADIFAARVMLGLGHAFNENVSFEDKLEVYENVLDPNDLRLLNTASLTSKLSGKLSLKLSHALTYDNAPVEGFEPLDQTTLLTFVATWL